MTILRAAYGNEDRHFPRVHGRDARIQLRYYLVRLQIVLEYHNQNDGDDSGDGIQRQYESLVEGIGNRILSSRHPDGCHEDSVEQL